MKHTRIDLLCPSVGRPAVITSCHAPRSCVALTWVDEHRATALVLIVDLRHANTGASVTNSAEQLVRLLQDSHLRPAGIGSKAVTWVIRDSEGAFDELFLSRGGPNGPEPAFRPCGRRALVDFLDVVERNGIILERDDVDNIIATLCEADGTTGVTASALGFLDPQE